jgi:hypothetical protein
MAVARACLKTERPQDAFLYLRAAENSASHRGEVRRLMGLAHLRAGDVDQAVDELMHAVRANPGDLELEAALDEALERLTEPISSRDLDEDAPGAGDRARREAESSKQPSSEMDAAPRDRAEQAGTGAQDSAFYQDDWEAMRRGLIAQDGFDIAATGLPAHEPADTSGAADVPAVCAMPEVPDAAAFADLSAADAPSRTDASLMDEAPVLPGTPALTLASAEADAFAAIDAPAVAEPSPTADVQEADAVSAAGFASSSDLRADAVVLAPLSSDLGAPPATTRSRTILSGKQTRSKSSACRRRRATVLAAAFAGAVTLALAAVTSLRPGRAAEESELRQSRPAVSTSRALAPAMEANGLSSTTPDAEPAPSGKAGEKPAGAPRAKPAAVEAAQPAADEEVPEPEMALEAPAASKTTGPSYEFMNRMGLPVPPGGILDMANSDANTLVFGGAPERDAESMILTFRTPASVEEVLAFYATAGINGFHPRTVQMGGQFLGVQRTVARASTRPAQGGEAMITISNPGVDQAAKQLVAETTIRIEIF